VIAFDGTEKAARAGRQLRLCDVDATWMRPGDEALPNVLTHNASTQTRAPRELPASALLHLCMLLTGLATAMLGPILPLIAHHWQLQDQQSGLLLMAQFAGSFSGGLTVQKHLRRSLLLGLTAAAVGFTIFALAPSLAFAFVPLYGAGWGVGQVITATNIIAGRRFGTRRGAQLALLNFSWSFGAMLAPLLAAWLTPRFALPHLIEGFSGCILLVLLTLLIEFRGAAAEVLSTSDIKTFAGDASLASRSRLAPGSYVYFIALLFFYGGVETSLSGWLTTYALRYGERTLALSEYVTLMFWSAITAGRAITSLLLLRLRESTLQRVSLILAAVFTASLAVAHGAWAIAACAVLIGLSLAPFFPTAFSILMGDRPSARQAGVVLAMSGVGASLLPSIMGVVSTHTGSLQVALAIPLFAAIVLLGMSFFPPTPTLGSDATAGSEMAGDGV
jgi:MFS transporter, FHS family, glucose/mannose:H+ symporter